MAEASGKTFYLLLCRECGDPEHPLPIPFGSPAERGKWASEHTRATGHDRWWVKDVPESGALRAGNSRGARRANTMPGDGSGWLLIRAGDGDAVAVAEGTGPARRRRAPAAVPLLPPGPGPGART